MDLEPLTLQIELYFINTLLQFIDNINTIFYAESLEEQNVKRQQLIKEVKQDMFIW